jgi:alkylation response protein AidB-like acyl-CoA dehydrogenase
MPCGTMDVPTGGATVTKLDEAKATAEGPSAADEVRAQVRAFLEAEWDPEVTLGEWWERLARSGWAVPTWPQDGYGKGLPRDLGRVVSDEIRRFGAVGAPSGLGMLLAGPTILSHGTPEQIERLVWPTVTGQIGWCQLFSEPGAGSDLAGLQSRAERDGDEWVVNGQKVWTSGGMSADMGMLLARTNVEVPKHKGISWFAIPMAQSGMDVRPLREMTGHALFSEVFMDDVRVADADLIGGLDNGWAVANTTLAYERAGLGAGGEGAMGAAVPGQKAGMLGTRAGDHVDKGTLRGATTGIGRDASTLIQMAQRAGRADDPILRQDLAHLHTLMEIGRYSMLRLKAATAAGRVDRGLVGAPNIAKLVQSTISKLQGAIGQDILGMDALLFGSDAPDDGRVAEAALFAVATSIYGGSDQIQRNIIGERVLGLPPEPRVDKDVPFRDLKVGTQQSA